MTTKIDSEVSKSAKQKNLVLALLKISFRIFSTSSRLSSWSTWSRHRSIDAPTRRTLDFHALFDIPTIKKLYFKYGSHGWLHSIEVAYLLFTQ